MTRPKVPDDKRQRTAQACDTCKRRKQKCNGQKPCNTCTKRSLNCSYTPAGSSDPSQSDSAGSPTKRRHIEDSSTFTKIETTGSLPPHLASPTSQASPKWESEQKPVVEAAQPVVEFSIPNTRPERPQSLKTGTDDDFEARTRLSTTSAPDEEAVVYSQSRMLQDPRGRLLYVGDSASLSYLQLIRMFVEGISGPSDFTLDPRRHKLMENVIELPLNQPTPHILPDKETTDVLVRSFFINTHGIIEVFSRGEFDKLVRTCYFNPLSITSEDLCLLYLVLAIGLVMATPLPGTREEGIIKRLGSGSLNQAEAFFRSAKALGDPVSGFEDADFWSVQALSLMSVYMLAVSKRNAAYAYYGMAVRSAFALGLHRVSETAAIFSAEPEHVIVRRNLWRSLFVLDRFLAASLGRPTAISEDDCCDEALAAPELGTAAGETVESSALDASVRSCQVIGQILKKVYSRRRISTKLAIEIADSCKTWTARLHPELHSSRAAGSISFSHGLAILHTNLLYNHSIILLTRPFFLYLFTTFTKTQEPKKGSYQSTPRVSSRMERFCEACVAASTHTIDLVWTAYRGGYLARRNPFALYFLFAASLIILSNEFVPLYRNPSYRQSIEEAIAIMIYCSETDPQAERLLFILKAFRDVVAQRRQSSTGAQRPMISSGFGSSYDPISSLFPDHPPHSTDSNKATRRNSFASVVGFGDNRHSPALHKPTMAPPIAPTVSMESGIGGLISTSAMVSPIPSMAIPASGAESVSDQAESLGDGEVEFEALWAFAGAGAGVPSSTSTGIADGSAAPFTSEPETSNTSRFAHFTAFDNERGPAMEGVMGSLNANVPLFSPAHF